MDIVELYHSEEMFSVEREREIAEEYEQYLAYMEQRADQYAYQQSVEI